MVIKFLNAPERTERGDKVPLFTCSSNPLQYRLDAISQGPKNSISRAQPPPTCHRSGYALIQNIMHGAV